MVRSAILPVVTALAAMVLLLIAPVTVPMFTPPLPALIVVVLLPPVPPIVTVLLPEPLLPIPMVWLAVPLATFTFPPPALIFTLPLEGVVDELMFTLPGLPPVVPLPEVIFTFPPLEPVPPPL